MSAVGRQATFKYFVDYVPRAVSHLTAALWLLVVGTWVFFYKHKTLKSLAFTGVPVRFLL